jgi:hypothetical protein
VKRWQRVLRESFVGTALLLTTLAMGCATGGRGGAVAELHLFGVPVALNLDGVPGPDGIGVRIYASTSDVARGVEIRQGVLEVLMFEGAVGADEVRLRQPRKVWSLGADALKVFTADTSLGVGYQLALRWENAAPRTPVATVVARYRGTGGKEFWSASNTISVALK